MFIKRRIAACLLLAAAVVGLPVTPTATAEPSACALDTTSTLRQGDAGACVRQAQVLLGGAGFDLPESGSFDADTVAAVRRFQASHQGLAIDGVIAAATWDALRGGGVPRYSMERGPSDGRHVILTFDDCPKSLASFTETVLAAERLGVRLVLFPYGQCVGWGKIDVAFARAHGHYVFSHSATHAHLDALSRDGILAEMDEPAIQGGYGRPPYGGWNWTVLDAFAAKGMRIWTWTFDTLDWTGRSRADVVDDVVAHAKPGDTILFHMDYAAFNRTALEAIARGLAARGLDLCRNTGAVRETADVVC